MIVDHATDTDREEIFAMLREYQAASPIAAHACVNETSAKKLVDLILHRKHGVILLSREKDQITGMLMAVYSFNLWDQDIRCMRELAWWVRPEYRGGTSAYRLLQTYRDLGNLLIKDNVIKYYAISKMVSSPDIDYGRYGFTKIEESWICQQN